MEKEVPHFHLRRNTQNKWQNTLVTSILFTPLPLDGSLSWACSQIKETECQSTIKSLFPTRGYQQTFSSFNPQQVTFLMPCLFPRARGTVPLQANRQNTRTASERLSGAQLRDGKGLCVRNRLTTPRNPCYSMKPLCPGEKRKQQTSDLEGQSTLGSLADHRRSTHMNVRW